MRNLTLLAAAALALTGCGPYLRWDARPSAPMVRGKVIISVADNREPKKGGAEKQEIGMQPGAFAIPETIRLPSPYDVAETMRELLGQAALTAGVGVAPVGDNAGTSKIAVEVQTFWCTGWTFHFVTNVSASVMIIDPAGAVRVPGMPLTVEDSAGDCRTAYRKALTRAYETAVAMLSQPNIQAAAIGAAPPGTPQ
jgi:hypothetical protein